jgi:futalosine hydrolase
MHEPNPSPKPAPWLLVVAAPAEAAAVLDGLHHPSRSATKWKPVWIDDELAVLMTGVGKANAAAGVGIALHSRTFGAVVNLGIAGALPAARPPELGDSIAASRSVYADEGVAMPDGSFVGCAAMGFPLGHFDDAGLAGSPELLKRVGSLMDRVGPIATVSTCSGTDGLARTVVERTSAEAEAMEGAAVGQVALELGVPFVEIRVISNTTGDRGNQAWAIGPALRRLGEISAAIAEQARTR